MVDLGKLFAVAEGLASEAIETSGTAVRFNQAGASNRETLAVEDGDLVLETDAIVINVGLGIEQFVPGVPVKPGDWKMLVPSGVTGLAAGQMVTITECRDVRKVNDRAKVLGIFTDSSGAMTLVHARP